MRTRLASRLNLDGTITAEGRARVVAAVRQAARELRNAHVDEVFAYATATIRDAPNAGALIAEVAEATGVRLGTLTGVEEAHLTFTPPAAGWANQAAACCISVRNGDVYVRRRRDTAPCLTRSRRTDAVLCAVDFGKLTAALHQGSGLTGFSSGLGPSGLL